MKQTLLFPFFLLALSPVLKAQPQGVYDGGNMDSLVFSIELNDSIKQHKNTARWAELDTANSGIWNMGTTTKAFFAMGTGNTRAIMTDTFNTYPQNVNDAFILKAKNWGNLIVTFTHKYETTEGHDGGIVEFSKDNGLHWENIKGDCNTDPFGPTGILTTNFYDTTDTLNNGEMAFSGTSTGWQVSRLQFFLGIPIKTTGAGGWDCISMDTVYLRFRFVSDDTLENKDGWIIDNIKVEYDKYAGVEDVKTSQFKVYPNPSAGIINFPAVRNEERYNIEISNAMGQVVLKSGYREHIDLRKQPRGIYIYKITDGESVFTGRLHLQ